MKKINLFVCLVLFFSSIISVNAQSEKSEYKISNRIHLSGDGGWDYLAVDEVNGRLFVSHSTQVNVVNLKTG